MTITKLSAATPAFETVVKKWECLSPKGLFTVEIIGVQKNEKGEFVQESTYQFFMNKQQLEELAEALVK